MLSQSRPHPSGLTVRDVVTFGRHPHRRRFGGLADDDRAAIDRAIDAHRHSPMPAAPSTSCRAASCSGSGWRPAWPRTPACSCSTSRPTTSTCATRSRSSTWSATSPTITTSPSAIVLHDLNHAARRGRHGRPAARGPGARDRRRRSRCSPASCSPTSTACPSRPSSTPTPGPSAPTREVGTTTPGDPPRPHHQPTHRAAPPEGTPDADEPSSPSRTAALLAADRGLRPATRGQQPPSVTADEDRRRRRVGLRRRRPPDHRPVGHRRRSAARSSSPGPAQHVVVARVAADRGRADPRRHPGRRGRRRGLQHLGHRRSRCPRAAIDVGMRAAIHNLEALFDTDPDLIIVEATRPRTRSSTSSKDYGVPVLATAGADAKDPIGQHARRPSTLIAQATGRQERAAAVLEEFDGLPGRGQGRRRRRRARRARGFVYVDGWVDGGNVVDPPVRPGLARGRARRGARPRERLDRRGRPGLRPRPDRHRGA